MGKIDFKQIKLDRIEQIDKDIKKQVRNGNFELAKQLRVEKRELEIELGIRTPTGKKNNQYLEKLKNMKKG